MKRKSENGKNIPNCLNLPCSVNPFQDKFSSIFFFYIKNPWRKIGLPLIKAVIIVSARDSVDSAKGIFPLFPNGAA
ncbi:MAG TPA: hypothetical protein DD376_02785 [Sutterella sp.]|nr:hypothetical protein [Sutterella sp.]